MHKSLFFKTDFVCICLLVQCPEATLTQFQCLRQTDRQTHREDSAQLASSEFSLLYYIFKYIYMNKYMHKYLFFSFYFFETDFVCVCLLVQCPEATLTQFQCLRQTDTPRGQRPASLQSVFPTLLYIYIYIKK